MLVEANVVGILLEAAAANIESVLANNADLGRTHTALSRALAVSFGMGTPDVGVTHVSVLLGLRKLPRGTRQQVSFAVPSLTTC